MYSTVLFDLDGTLTDPAEGITNSVAYALRKWNIEVKDKTELYKFIGPPLVDSFVKYFNFSIEEANLAVGVYREYFSKQGIYENKLYSGIRDMLEGLRKAGKTLLVATSKPECFAKEILRYFELDGYFEFVAGATMDGSMTEKGDVIAYALKYCDEDLRSNIIMVGDREYDILGAKENGIASVGVLYGYGSREELTWSGATYLASSPKDILKILV